MEATDHETHSPKKRPSSVRALKCAGFILVILAVGLILGFFLSHIGGDKDIKTKLTEATQGQDLGYDLYFPANIPAGYEVEDETIIAAEVATTVTLVNSTGNRLTMAQQKRPRLMEEVNKIREFDTAIGKAYIADLNGRTAGFILAGDTLIIINSSGQIDLNVLRQFMEGVQKA